MVKKVSAVLLMICFLSLLVYKSESKADEITTLIKKAEVLYKNGHYDQAIEELKFVIGQIQTHQMDEYKKLLPSPPWGWKGKEPTGSVAGPAFLGGGIQVSRVYTGPSGKEVKISIVSQSPLVRSLLSLLSNLSILGESGNTKFFIYKGEKAIERFYPQEKRGELDIAMANRALISIKGEGVTEASTLRMFLDKLPWNKLHALISYN